MKPLVSVIVPIYQVEAYLETCLKSMQKQTFRHFEVICVNDGSQDGSRNIALQYVTNYPDIFKLIDKTNGGLSDARNHGLKHAKGAYCVFVDADDYVHETYLEKLHQSIRAQDADISVCDMSYEYPNTSKFSSGGEFMQANIQSWPNLIAINNSACNKMFKRELFNDQMFPKGIWYEDLATIPVLLMKARRVTKVDEVLYYYVQRDTSIVHSENAKIFDIFIALKMIEEKIHLQDATTTKTLNSVYQEMVIIQGIELTLLRIKDFSQHRIMYLERLHQKTQDIYPNWFTNPIIIKNGFKKFVMFALFRFKMFSILMRLFR